METTYKKKSTAKGTRKVKDTRVSYVAKASAKAQVIDAVYDGRVFLPQQTPMLKANTRVRITIEQVKVKRAKKKSFLDTARSIKIDAPADFSSNVDEYLYQGKSFDCKCRIEKITIAHRRIFPDRDIRPRLTQNRRGRQFLSNARYREKTSSLCV